MSATPERTPLSVEERFKDMSWDEVLSYVAALEQERAELEQAVSAVADCDCCSCSKCADILDRFRPPSDDLVDLLRDEGYKVVEGYDAVKDALRARQGENDAVDS
jgi:hypothetical protein